MAVPDDHSFSKQCCPETELISLIELVQNDAADATQRLESLLEDWPLDARLYFLKGSVLAGEGKPAPAFAALNRAVELAPDYHIARFQLGFYQLTSGDLKAANSTWEGLTSLPDGHYLQYFVSGLIALVEDRFDDCIDKLQRGIAANIENRPLNGDMQMLIDQCHALVINVPHEASAGEPSATSLLLDRFGLNRGVN